MQYFQELAMDIYLYLK